ncbi:hypothetical protein POSPLADRAFT_1065909 [Postia placenta MAD-698-R-SB12]|uniref:TPR-like protein n=1 Tax=Postia placenta MAD-698-R-SB12 TaxID=670580 RepID=A0A1X6N2W5_9APHY|nr:hypothetical protein POSPLADRAFT_1065909 [Postia placenta MAD-698-R-SB12]OSX62812.1 hypothetical protein POSPLADRAFT_1065909 [Postia placenta MAD-698-R-SB12]
MAQTKDHHYWKQLRETLTGGRWDHAFPAKTPKGAALSWLELLRKFNKHCVGHTHVSELASQTQALSLLLSANSGLDANLAEPQGPLILGDECVLPEERLVEATAGYNALKSLESTGSDSIRLAVAYYAYALRRPSECLQILSQVKFLSDVQSRTSATSTPRAQSLRLRIPSGGPDGSVSSAWSGSTVSGISISSVAEISDGSTWAMTETIRSICLQGMSHETISVDAPQSAFDAYLVALPLITSVASEIAPYIAGQPPPAASNGVGAIDASPFGRYRELWRWIERLLRRAVILGSRLCDIKSHGPPHNVFWQILDLYRTCSAYWPPTFRPHHRGAVAVIHLRACVLRVNASPVAHPTAMTRQGDSRPNLWISAARSVVQEYRTILSLSTQFPRAGERNTKVEDLVDLCVAVWEADGAVGEYAGWVIDVLWWATRLTFNSYKVFRHMTRLFYVSGDTELAKRTLRLYVQVVSKARETRFAEENTSGAMMVHDDETDTDRNWVQMLTQGARMLCRLAMAESDGSIAMDEAKEAGVMVEKAKTRLDPNEKDLVANVQLAEGIWLSTMAYAERDPRSRMSRFADSLACLLASAETYLTPSVHYHLALAYARPGQFLDLQKAITHARSAVEDEPGEIRHWHLLGLLLTATGDWKAAQSVLEVGAGVCEVELADDGTATQKDAQPNGVNGVYPSAAHVNGSNGDATDGRMDSSPVDPKPDSSSGGSMTVLESNAVDLPPSCTLLRPIPDRPAPSRHDAFEHALQLRMTQLALAEFVEGPEGAGDRWVEVFQWFSERREVGADDLPSTEQQETARPNEARTSQIHSPADAMSDQIPVPPTPIPITVTPASPALNEHPEVRERMSHETRSSSFEDQGRDMSRGKKVREVLKDRVHKGQAGITRISKKIGHNVGRHGSIHIKRSNSAPDLHAVLGHSPYQASSIHLRHQLSVHASQQDLSLLDAPPPPPPPPPPPSQSPASALRRQTDRATRDRRLLSNLWLMSAATFRRLGKIEQARAAIQEAEVKDDDNPAVWVQLGLYYMALNNHRRALEAFQKALFISPEDVSATIHMCRLYLTSSTSGNNVLGSDRDNVDLAVGLLSDLTRGAGWDVPEAWYFLAKEYGLQERKDRERECLSFALTLSETRTLRDLGTAVGWCL